MFYSQDILQKRGGKFGIIWIAATRGIALTKRDYSSVNLRRLCEDIIEYIRHEAAQHSRPTFGRPRFSLYLSSQLMYGVCKVYKKQNEYLLSDITTMIFRVRSFVVQAEDIDLKQKRFEEVTLPEIPILQHPEGPHVDPFFGTFRLMREAHLEDIPDIEFWKPYQSSLSSESPRGGQISKSPSPDILLPDDKQSPSFQPELGSPLQVANASITLSDLADNLSSTDIIQVPGEMDLPPLETLMEELFTDQVDDLQQQQQQQQPEQIPVDEGGLEAVVTPQVRTPPTRDVSPPRTESTEPRQRRERRPRSPGASPRQRTKRRKQDLDLGLELSVVEPTPTIRGRRRRRHFTDMDVQLPRQQLRQQLGSGHETCSQMELPQPNVPSVKQLLNKPYSRYIQSNVKLLHLWRRNTRKEYEYNKDASLDRPLWTVPGLGQESSNGSSDGSESGHASSVVVPGLTLEPLLEEDEDARDVTPELGRDVSIEKPRDASLSILGVDHGPVITPQRSLLSVEGDTSRSLPVLPDTDSTRKKSGTRRTRPSTPLEMPSLEEESLYMDPSVDQFTLHDIPEDQELALDESRLHASPTLPSSPVLLPEKLEGETSSVADVSVELMQHSAEHFRLLRILKKLTKRNPWVTFWQICPTATASRTKAASLLSALLDLCALRRVIAKQSKPFGDIYITSSHLV